MNSFKKDNITTTQLTNGEIIKVLPRKKGIDLGWISMPDDSNKTSMIVKYSTLLKPRSGLIAGLGLIGLGLGALIFSAFKTGCQETLNEQYRAENKLGLIHPVSSDS